MKFRCVFIAVVTLAALCCCLISVSASNDYEIGSWDPAPAVTPPLSHPRVFFTSDDIAKIRTNLTAPENEFAYKTMLSYLNTDYTLVTPSTTYDEETLAKIETNAFYFLIAENEGEKEKALANAKAGINIITSMIPVASSDICRLYGRMINVLSEIYDWCYYELSDEQKQYIVDKCIEYSKGYMEIGWPPSKLGSVTGHGSEMQLQCDLLSFAIATYNEYPDFWNYIGGRFYDEYVPAREFELMSQYHNQGTDYGNTGERGKATDYAYALITGMGVQAPFDTQNTANTGYASIYMRRPDGRFHHDGDVYNSRSDLKTHSFISGSTVSMLMKSSLTGDGYLKGDYYRRALKNDDKGNIVHMLPDSSPVLVFVLSNPDVEIKLQNNLPLSRYFGSPIGIMTARTGWQEGVNSNSVSAFMKIGEYQFNNHQHLDAGNFEIYYKGMLATESGNYNTFGDEEHYMYTVKSVAHNTVLIHNPNEVKLQDGVPEFGRGYINDGGQRAVSNGKEFATHEKQMAADSKVATVIAHEIDPKNPQIPYYTYLKGDLTNAYSADKVENFKRSFMFLNLKDNKKTPAAMIVFDRVESKSEYFRKSWLMHSIQKPEIDGNIFTFANTTKRGDFNCSGQMVLKAVLPKENDLYSEVVGDSDNWGTVNNWKWDEDTDQWTNYSSNNYDTNTSYRSELDTYRLELSPLVPDKENYFLNVMLVGDAGETLTLDAPLFEENPEFYGTEVDNRIVFFARNSENNVSFSYNFDSDSKTYKYTICDMAKGTYRVSIDDLEIGTFGVTEEGKVLSFDAIKGKISAEKILDTPMPTLPAAPIEYNSIYVKNGSMFLKTDNTQSGEDNYLIVVQTACEGLGYLIEKDSNAYSLYRDSEKFATIVPGSESIITKSGMYMAQLTPYENSDGLLVMNITDFHNICYYNGTFNNVFKTLFVNDKYKDGNMINASLYVQSDGTLCVKAKIYNEFSTELMCGLFNDDCLIEACKMNDLGNGYHIALFNTTDIESYYIKIFPWGENIIPFYKTLVSDADDSNMSAQSYWDSASDEDKKIEFNSNEKMLVTQDNNIIKFKKTTTDWQATSQYILKERPVTASERKFIKFSTNVRVGNVSGNNQDEVISVRLRGSSINGDSGGYAQLKTISITKKEYKLDFIVDVHGACVYMYIDGNLYSTLNLKDTAMFVDGEYRNIVAIAFYILGTGYTGTEFELFDTCMDVISNATLADVQDRLNRFCVKK